MNRRCGCGFTLIELTVTSLIVAVVLLAAFSLLGAVLRTQSATAAATAVEDQAAVVDQAILDAAEFASYVSNPAAAGVSSNEFRVWKNVNPLDGSPIVAGVDRTFTDFCKDDDGDILMYRSNTDMAPASASPITCSSSGSPPTGVVRTRLTGGSMPATVDGDLFFSRTANNAVEFYYTLLLPAPPSGTRREIRINRHTSVQLQAAL